MTQVTLYFSKRRLHSMFEQLGPWLNQRKRRDLAARLNSALVDQALPAEIELALLWAITKTGHLEVEPEWLPGKEKPDAYTESLIEDRPAVIEITAQNNGRIAFEEPMIKTAHRIAEFASTIQRRFGDRLRFAFPYRASASTCSHTRTPTARMDYRLSSRGKEQIEQWIAQSDDRLEYLHYEDGEVVCQIQLTQAIQIPMSQRVWTTVPPETHDLVNNPLYDALDRKRKQLGAIPKKFCKVVFIVDAGSELLRKIDNSGITDWTNPKTGDQIIENFLLKKRSEVDVVVVFTPRAGYGPGFSSLYPAHAKLFWYVKPFWSPDFSGTFSGLETIWRALPSPKREGYQARSAAQQFHTSPLRGRPYKGWKMTTGPDLIKIRVSARALFDMMTGVPFDQIMKGVFPEQLSMWRDNGLSIIDTAFESGSPDSDDDYVVFTLASDPGRMKFPTA